jgi:hypothetical protein
LKAAILGALEAAGGEEGSVGYLRRLAIENSSAFASLLGKVLPTKPTKQYPHSTLARLAETKESLFIFFSSSR